MKSLFKIYFQHVQQITTLLPKIVNSDMKMLAGPTSGRGDVDPNLKILRVLNYHKEIKKIYNGYIYTKKIFFYTCSHVNRGIGSV